jgi:hypothetical protein
MKAIVKVTKEIIAKAEQHSAVNCPVALAIQEALGNFAVLVGPFEWFYNDKSYVLPEIAQKFIHAFDNGEGPVEPFEFEIDTAKYVGVDPVEK